jgi:hypothetical protein
VKPWLLLAVAALTVPAWPHPYHAARAQMELNGETGRLEVALEVIPEDLQRALRRRTAEPVVLETTAGVDQLILAYLRDRFVVLSGGGRPQPLTWVGKELDPKGCVLYFEVELAGGLEGARLRNTVLFELEPGQINTVRLEAGKLRRSLTFHRQQPEQELAPAEREKESPSGSAP